MGRKKIDQDNFTDPTDKINEHAVEIAEVKKDIHYLTRDIDSVRREVADLKGTIKWGFTTSLTIIGMMLTILGFILHKWKI